MAGGMAPISLSMHWPNVLDGFGLVQQGEQEGSFIEASSRSHGCLS
jgi:hypothetical protein